MAKEIKATVVDFCGNGDGITALYLNGQIHLYGDYYHDKIDETISGFIDGMRYVGGEDIEDEYIALDENHPLVTDTWDNGNPPPSRLEHIDFEERIKE